MNLRRRTVLILVLALSGLVPLQRSIAQGAGSELIEEVAAHEVGGNAQVSLEDVAAFDPDGGEAVFEPGTSNEEAFSYASVDADTSRLIGLTRAAPLDHPLGAFVQALEQQPAPTAERSPAPTEAPEETPSSSGGDESPVESTTSDGTSESAESSSDAGDEAPGEASQAGICVLERPAQECVDPDPCAEMSVCSAILQEILDDPCGFFEIDCGATDPCDPDNTGQTCLEYIGDILAPFINDADPCDPDDTGQTCVEYVQPGPCDISADSPYVGDLLFPPRNDVVIGNASARCPFPGPVTLVICLEYGLLSEVTIEQPPCSTWPSTINRVDGHDWQPCKAGFWRTYAFVMVGGFVLDEDHSGVVQVLPEDCLRIVET